MNSLKNFVKYQPIVRRISTTSRSSQNDLANLKEWQKRFQVDDGVPVHLKRGGIDRVTFAFTAFGVLCVNLWGFATIKRLIYPPKPE